MAAHDLSRWFKIEFYFGSFFPLIHMLIFWSALFFRCLQSDNHKHTHTKWNILNGNLETEYPNLDYAQVLDNEVCVDCTDTEALYK